VAAVRRLFDSLADMYMPTNRQIQDELRPVFHQIHSFFVPPRSIVPVVALKRRAHGEKILNGDLSLARIRILKTASTIGPYRKPLGIHATQLSVLDGDAHKHVGDALGGRTRVAKSICVTLDIVLVDELAVASDKNASDFLKFFGSGGGTHRAEFRFRNTAI